MKATRMNATRRMLAAGLVAGALAVGMMMTPMGIGTASAAAPRNVVKEGCEGAGYIWDDQLGCANKACPDGGRPGDTRWVRARGGAFVGIWHCDGFTGQWEKIG